MARELSVELTTDGDQLEIHGDKAALLRLVETIERLLAAAKNDHVHMFTPSWGGDQLSSEPQNDTNRVLNKVTIYYWSDTEASSGRSKV
ncbi:MAG: Imm32 family immunity protein [Gemmatimonadota bacterium]